MKKELNEESLQTLKRYMNVTEKIHNIILRHCNRYDVEPDIYACYSDWNDFCSHWCDGVGYTLEEINKIYHAGKGEFLTLNTGQIMQFGI